MSYNHLCEIHGVETYDQVRAQIAADEAYERAEMAELVAAFGPYVFPTYLFGDLPF